jgi:hypothetical protein
MGGCLKQDEYDFISMFHHTHHSGDMHETHHCHANYEISHTLDGAHIINTKEVVLSTHVSFLSPLFQKKFTITFTKEQKGHPGWYCMELKCSIIKEICNETTQEDIRKARNKKRTENDFPYYNFTNEN